MCVSVCVCASLAVCDCARVCVYVCVCVCECVCVRERECVCFAVTRGNDSIGRSFPGIRTRYGRLVVAPFPGCHLMHLDVSLKKMDVSVCLSVSQCLLPSASVYSVINVACSSFRLKTKQREIMTGEITCCFVKK